MVLSSRFSRIFSGYMQAEVDAAEADKNDSTFVQERMAVTSVKKQCPFLKGNS